MLPMFFYKIELPRFQVFPRILNDTAELVSVECQVTEDTVADLCWLTGDNSVVSKNNEDVSLPPHFVFLPPPPSFV